MTDALGLPPAITLALRRAFDERRPYWTRYGPVIDVTFPAADTDRDIAHGLGQTPSGYHVVYADGPVYARAGAEWATKELAWLRAPAANTHARVIFFSMIGDAPDA